MALGYQSLDRKFIAALFAVLSLSGPYAFSWDKSFCADPKNSQNALGFILSLNKANLLSTEHFKQQDSDVDSDDYYQMTEAEAASSYTEEQFKLWKIAKDLHFGRKIGLKDACTYIDLNAKFSSRHGSMTPEKWNIDQAEFLSVYSYTSNDFVAINPAIRKKTDNLKLLNALIETLDSALLKLPIFQGTVFRGVSLKPEIAKGLEVGSIFKDDAYLSTSTSMPYGGSYQFVIQSQTGREVFHLSPNPDEKEVLFPRRTQFKITKIYQKNATTFVEMTEQSQRGE